MAQCVPTQHNEEYIRWIYHIFGDCVYGTQDAISVLLGYLSILCWLNAQLPQVIENYKVGSADSLSIKFLSIWLAGDLANLLGCILTHQLPFQLYLGIYFVSIDLCLLGQWVYYSKFQKPKTRSRSTLLVNDNDPLSSTFVHPSVRTPLLIERDATAHLDEAPYYSASASPGKWYTLNNTFQKEEKTKTALLAIMFLGMQLPTSTLTTATTSDTSMDPLSESLMIGRTFAWICTVLYLMSRIPQIRKNFKRKSVHGLSPALFIFAACGNLTYTASVLSHPGHTKETLLEAVPYLIGSAGTLVFDFTIFCQFLWYSRQRKAADQPV